MQRHQFVPIQRDPHLRHDLRTAELARWCDIFDTYGLTPEFEGSSLGNLSFRTSAGFIITPSRAPHKGKLTLDDFVEVVRIELDSLRVHYLGGHALPRAGGNVPSSDTLMHERIYTARPDVQAIFHGHDDLILRLQDELGVIVTDRETPYGTREDAELSANALADGAYLIRRNHGFIGVGRTMEHAGRVSLEVHFEARRLESGAV